MAEGSSRVSTGSMPVAHGSSVSITGIVMNPANCPPAAAIDGPMHFFRLSRGDPPVANDFLTAEERNALPNADQCLRKAVSSHTDRRDSEKLRRMVKFFAQHVVCAGTVPHGAGKLLATPSYDYPSHWSWWPPAGMARHTFFAVVP